MILGFLAVPLRGLMRIGRAVGLDEWNIQIKVNPTQVRDVMGHPVVPSDRRRRISMKGGGRAIIGVAVNCCCNFGGTAQQQLQCNANPITALLPPYVISM